MSYHTALRPDEEEDRPSIVRFEANNGSAAFVHDVNLGIPNEMLLKCDIIYSEPPWKDGYLEFLARAGLSTGIALPYEKWLFRFSGSLCRSNKTFVIVAGHAAVRHMACEWIHPLNLNGSLAVAIGAGLPRPHENVKDAEQLLHKLAIRYANLGDPCCGFGRTARIATEAGKRFFCSDINSRCIGTIARDYPEWANGRSLL